MSINLGSAFGKVGIDLSGVQSSVGMFDSAMGKIESRFNGVARFAANASRAIVASTLAMAAGATGVAVTALNAYRSWGEQLDTLQDIFGMSDESATGFAVAMKIVLGDVEDGIGGFSYLTRAIANTRTALAQSGVAIGEYRAQIGDVAEGLRDTRIGITENTYETIKGIESSLADSIESINESLAEKLADIAYQRGKIDRDLTKSLIKFDLDTKDSLRSAHSARDRRDIRRKRAEQRREMIDAANEQKAELARQEERAKVQAAKQIALAEKVAHKQILAAERAAEKQIAAAEKAAEKQTAAIERAIKKQEQQVKAGTPLLTALDKLGLKFSDIADESKPFDARMAKIMDAFAKLPEGVDASAIALELFGRSGVKWLDFLRGGSKALADAKKRGYDLGLIFDPKRAEMFNRALNLLNLSLFSFGVNIGERVLPYAQRFVDMLNEMIRVNMPEFQAFLDRLVSSFEKRGFQGLFDQLGIELGKLGQTLDKWRNDPKNKAQLEAVGGWIMARLGDAVLFAIRGATWMADASAEFFKKLRESLTPGSTPNSSGSPDNRQKTEFRKFADTLVKEIATMLTAAINASVELLALMGAIVGKMLEWVGKPEGQAAIADLTNGFVDAFQKALTDRIGKIDWGKILRDAVARSEASQEESRNLFKNWYEGQQKGQAETDAKATLAIQNWIRSLFGLPPKTEGEIEKGGSSASSSFGGGIGSGLKDGQPILNKGTRAFLNQGFVTQSTAMRSYLVRAGTDVVNTFNYAMLARIASSIGTLQSTLRNSLQFVFTTTQLQSFYAGMDIGSAIVRGIQAGIVLSTPALLAQVISLINNLKLMMRALLAISSPSAVMAKEVGMPMGQGVLQGLMQSLDVMPRVLQAQLVPATAGASNSFAYSPTHNWPVTGRPPNYREWERKMDEAAYRVYTELMNKRGG